MSLNKNKRIPVIHQLIVVFGCKSGLLIIPLMYFASTSTVRFFTPKMKTCEIGHIVPTLLGNSDSLLQ
jgi:hypothetical protein